MSEILYVNCLWGIFWVYWIITGIRTQYNIKTEKAGQKRSQRFSHVFFVVAAFWLSLSFYNNSFFGKVIIQGQYVKIIGLLLLTLSLVFSVWARILLFKNWSGVIQKVQGQRLVTKGPYKYIRNPIYTGIIGGFIGTFITVGTLASLIGTLIIVVAYIVKISKEEMFLIEYIWR
ncbi:methyltransferase family protein [Propionispora hippei]|uniref:Protein-S-isoprenylcysteine O-methyltransferase Ste14 n=1 Tax=Propionispora hippei DSM 15287 TaxID=1123003 RepID=A0A1M6NTU2_9FIRM|nr:methyltransferase [Propionispora hippei]SHJ99149.1 Protein-S-isoprenylcysteine O-methyltransferase Ste14 [Propionispora hippei DSM 15287]